MAVNDNSATAKRLYGYFNDRKLDDALALVPDEFIMKNVPMNTETKGKEGFRDFSLLWQNAFPDSRAEITNMISSGDYVVTEFTGKGTHNGVLESPMGEIPPTGKKINIPFCEVLRFKNGKVIESHFYFDVNTIMQQLEIAQEKA